MDEEYIGGKHSVMEAIRAGRTINKIWIAENAQKQFAGPIVAEAKNLGIIVQFTDKRKLDQMAGRASAPRCCCSSCSL